MKTFIKIAAILIFSILLISCNEELVEESQTGTLKGKVVKKGSNEPLSNVKVFTNPTTKTVFSAADGTFEIADMPIGNYSVKAELSGYLINFLSVNIQSENQIVTAVFEMEDDESLNSPPTVPLLISPADNAENLPLAVQLSWSATDPDSLDVLKYRLIVKNNFNAEILDVKDIKENNYTLKDLKFGVSYFWQISVSDDIHPEVFSAVSRFTTNSVPANRFHFVRKQSGNLFIVSSNEAGTSFQFTPLSHNSWRPRKNNNAGLIAFLRTEGGNTHIFTAKPDGSDVFKVTTVPLSGFNNYELDFAWKTNGKELIYANFDKLYRINKDGSGQELIYTTPDGSIISECDWNYDSSRIALKTNDFNGYNTKIYVIDMLGMEIKTILTGTNGGSGGLDFSTDGNALVYTHDLSGFQDGNYRQLNSHIFIYNFTENSLRDISEESEKQNGTNDLDPRFSPNNAQIIFMNTSNDGVSQKNVVVVDLNNSGSDLERMTLFENAEMPDYE